MDREPLVNRKTAISYKTEEKTVMRGYDLSELAEEGYSFCDALFVMYQNRIPTEEEEKMLKYEMGVFLEHSMSPSAVGAIGVGAGRPNLPVCVAAAVSTFGGVHGPGAAHGYMLNKYLERAKKEGKTVDEMAKTLVDEYMDSKRPVMGMGQPQHIDSDPRAETASRLRHPTIQCEDHPVGFEMPQMTDPRQIVLHFGFDASWLHELFDPCPANIYGTLWPPATDPGPFFHYALLWDASEHEHRRRRRPVPGARNSRLPLGTVR